MYALIPSTIYTSQQTLTHSALLIEDDRILDLIPTATLPTDCPLVELAGQSIAPGFIDLQLNGCGGVMFNDTITAATLDTMHRTNLRSGTTSFLPTLITTRDADMVAAIEVVDTYRQSHSSAVLGLHLEGPYLNPKRKGIHAERYVRPLDGAMLDWLLVHADTVKLLTLAPEMVSLEAIHQLSEAGILVSAGHSDASYEQAIAGFDAGVRMVTHLFNAMSPWQGRNPGLVGATLQRSDVYAGIIADGHHVHFASIQLAQRIKQDKLILVSDATPPAGTQMESFWIGGQEVFYRDGKCVSAEGRLGGSALTLIEAIANCVQQIGIPLDEALRMASTYPAAALQREGVGAIAPNSIANLVIFNSQLQVTGVVDRGQYQSCFAPVLV
ncbi:MAG: N-acetylglucosamine-6-phosphate deacetylase [Leptolyngbyaceae cyanobacterium SL_7_1]|nr:N-acetylglucosamine-6-phosphate deacetylase [Leptolyngbyaceae cyanobacterium SL_7_1]